MSNNLPIRGHAGASEYLLRIHGLKRSPATLAKYACRGVSCGVEAPHFRKAGRDVLYLPEDLDAFVQRLIRDPRAAA
jgi:hypothetical protein